MLIQTFIIYDILLQLMFAVPLYFFFLLLRTSLGIYYCSTALTKIQRPLYEKHPMMKFSWTRTEDADIVSISFPCMVKAYMLINFYFA